MPYAALSALLRSAPLFEAVGRAAATTAAAAAHNKTRQARLRGCELRLPRTEHNARDGRALSARFARAQRATKGTAPVDFRPPPASSQAAFLAPKALRSFASRAAAEADASLLRARLIGHRRLSPLQMEMEQVAGPLKPRTETADRTRSVWFRSCADYDVRVSLRPLRRLPYC